MSEFLLLILIIFVMFWGSNRSKCQIYCAWCGISKLWVVLHEFWIGFFVVLCIPTTIMLLQFWAKKAVCNTVTKDAYHEKLLYYFCSKDLDYGLDNNNCLYQIFAGWWVTCLDLNLMLQLRCYDCYNIKIYWK